MPKPVFDAAGFLGTQGLTLKGVEEDGHVFETQDGQPVKLDVMGYLKSKGVPVDRVDVEFNDASTPLDQSPVGIMDRMKLAVGNTRGQVKYLKSKFDDVAVSEENGLLVKNRGVWQKVDKSGMDPWELTQDIAEGAVNLIPSAVGSAVGAAKGAAAGTAVAPGVGTVAGSIVGAGVGGAAASAGVRNVLGRLAGTYDATPEEEVRDLSWDFVLNAGGQTLALGAKPVAQMFGKSIKNLSKMMGADQVGNASKDVLTDILGRTTGAGPVAMRTVFDETDDVVKALGKAKAGTVSANDIVLNLRQGALESVQRMVDETPRALSRRFGELKDALVNSVDDSFQADVSQLIKGAQEDLAAKGLGVFDDVASKQAVSIAPMGGDFAQKAAGAKEFRLLTNKEAAKSLAAGGEGRVLDDATREALDSIVGVMNEYGKIKSVSGGNGAKVLMDLKKNMNAAVDSILDRTEDRNVKYFVTQFKEAFSKRLLDTFKKGGAEDAYVATSALYGRFASAANVAQRVSGSENGAEVLLNKLVSGIGANQTYKDFAGDMVELLGKEGQNLMKTVRINHAASAMAPVLPKLTFGSLSAGGIGVGAAAAGVVSAPVAAAAAAQASPRFVLKEVQHARHLFDFLKGMPKAQQAKWLRNPAVMRETFKMAVDNMYGEDQVKSDLLKQAGALP